ncbi:hypothetical protein VTI74DRAFT_9831 [Chaetomium olivicolor]
MLVEKKRVPSEPRYSRIYKPAEMRTLDCLARRILPSTGAVSAVRTPGVFTCRACLTRLLAHQRRAFFRSAPRHAAPPSPVPAGLAELSSRKLISVSGPDAAKYLQGGRILHDVFIYHDARDTAHPPGHSWLVEVDAAEADRLQKHIRRYKLRAKFDVRLLDEGEGAELTIRTEHRGVVRKRILPCVLYPDTQTATPPGALVAGYRPEIEDGVTAEQIPREASIGRAPGGKKGRSAGKWLSRVGNVGLALCWLEIMTDVVLPGEASSGAGGFRERDEFIVGVGEGEERKKFRIKAFVPEWLREGLVRGEGH